ncbi:pancreatic secretory granule membrane major glycoprotein GP2-like [Bombina bombina]|uniref:pancreatic secretory granule membrane major glycoprotein GP2-like n=1 Tax=Bombina bombina TaxID=8345 RepID=UPI00235ABE91|nr:pancreatic secretory granule membrane major glycoprotein GP2-like [Bombina bombina]
MQLLSALVILTVLAGTGSALSCYGGLNGDPPMCSNCTGSCTAGIGCKCSTSSAFCLPNPHTCSMNSTACCLSNLSWHPDLGCCVEEAFCSPMCLPDETCTYVNSTPTCKYNSTLYQSLHLGINNVSTSVTCGGNNMTVSVSKNLLEYLHYNPSASSLSDGNCTGAFEDILNGQKVYSLAVSNANKVCGNTMTKTSTQVTYTNTLHIPPNSDKGIVTVSIVSLQFSCTYNLTMQTALLTVIKPVMSSGNLNFGGAGDAASTTIAAYVNPTYTQPLEQSQQQDLPLGSTLYFGMSSQFPDTAFVLRVERCFATPYNDAQSPLKAELIQGGCPTGDGPYIKVEENGVSKEVRFSIASFAFNGFDVVYIFCNARLCSKASEKCSECSSSRSEVETTQFSMGPFQFTGLEENASSHTALSSVLILGSLLCLWIL